MMKELNPETVQFIHSYRRSDVRTLAFQAERFPQVNMTEALVQIAGWQVAARKIPLWAEVEGIRYPQHLSMEQCSSEVTARYKASLVEGRTFADLTGGFGVDFSFLARKFREAHYVERQESLCELAEHNFPLLGLPHAKVHHADGVEFLRTMEPVDFLFLDPSRRDSHGGKTVAISDCVPDVGALESLLLEKAHRVMIKLSPMLDVASALRELKQVRKVFILAVNNECKELLLLLEKPSIRILAVDGEVSVTCEQLVDNFSLHRFEYRLSDEKKAVCPLASSVGKYLYEPGAALMKAAPFHLLAERFGVEKLHANSHLYTSDAEVDFPGRRFKVDAVSGFGKKELKTFLRDVEKANLTVRNFPSTADELRKRLKLKDGGDTYLFATTLATDERVLIKCSKMP